MSAGVPVLVAEYVAHRIDTDGMLDSTAEATTKMLRRWHVFAGAPSTWTAERVEAWTEDPSIASATRKNRRNRLRGYLRWATATGVVADDVDLGLAAPALVVEYVEGHLARGEVGERTARRLRLQLRRWHRHAGPIAGWTVDTFEAWSNATSVAVNTQRQRRSDVRAYLAWLAEVGRVDVEPGPARRRVEVPALVAEYVTQRLRRGELVESSAEVAAAVLGSWHRHAGDDPTVWSVEQVDTWALSPRLAPATRRSRSKHLRGYVAWLSRRGVIDGEVTGDLARVRVPKPQPRDLTVDEVRRLVVACPDDRARLVVMVMVQCGLHVGDLCRARVSDVDVDRRVLAVRGKGGQGEPTHWVPIPAEAWQHVTRRLERVDLGPWLVTSERRRHDHRPMTPNAVSRMVRAWMTDAGVRAPGISSHSLRHSCAQHMLDAGADIRQVQHALGHSSVTVTEQYLRRQPPGLAAAMEGRSYST